MPRTNPQTPLARLINPRLSTLGFSRVELMHKLGYANTDRGLRRFDDFLATGRITTHLLKNLPDVLGLDTLNVEDAAATTRQQIADAEEAAARERFRPHIIVLANRQDGKHIPVFVKAWIWRNRVIGLPDDFGGLSSSQQMKQATRIVRGHYHEHGGELGIWGRITGYRLQRTFDHAVILNTDGTISDGFNRDGEVLAPEIRIKGKRIPMGIFEGGCVWG